MHRRTLLAALATLPALPARAETRIAIVAGENMYGDIARQIAGPDADITSILSNPDEDPHLFEASPSVARALSAARIVIVNGADYDPWLTGLLRAGKSRDRRVIDVAALAHRKPGDNPHLWYSLDIVLATARALAAEFAAADPAHKADFAARLATFQDSVAPLRQQIATLRARFAGQSVTATEPVFGYMAADLGLVMRNERFQLAIMNDTEPRPSDVAAFEADLRQHRVRALLYNSQATEGAAKRLLGIAQAAHIPVVGVSETMPAGQTWQSWMSHQLDALAAALATP
jgi:zinc/manganese transport system substrate-binding protein